ncbi:MAG: alpha/beta fold hydrolase [Myxococcota bacterium]|nr:alpha/beta fold hydrolase [Myxococcota bacterium]
MTARSTACLCAGILAFAVATDAHAGDATRIQLVAEIPALALSVVDASGDVAGEVDGITTDGLEGPGPGQTIGGAQLRLSIPEPEGTPSWGHLDENGSFVADLPATKADGHYSEVSPGATLEKLYDPPIEFDISGPNNAAQRPLELAVRIEKSATEAIVLSKTLQLVKPALVLVHGISLSPASWVNFEPEFRNNRGFKTFTVDHSGGAYTSGDPWWGGNSDIHVCYTAVRGGLAGLVGVAEALDRFRTGHASAHAGLKIATQKVDLIGSSYGGLCSRWYVEQAPDYDDDVRKLITLGTPHRGVAATNMAVQAATDEIIANASSQLLNPLDTVAGTLQFIDTLGFLRWKKVYTPGENDVVPSLHVMTFGSEVLGQLNDSAPFRDDVAYGSIVGTDEQLDIVLLQINIHYHLDPVVSVLAQQKSYFPFMAILDAGEDQSDAVVPTWSATLPARSTDLPLDHLSFHDSPTAHDTIAIWLQDPTLPRGAAHRAAFQAEVIDQQTSRANAYVGSTLVGTESVGGGLVENAIVQVKFSGPTLSEAGGMAVLDSGGGIVTATMTGMVRADVTGTPQLETVTLDNDGTFGDTPLHAVTESLDPGSTPAGEFFPFSIDATFSRGQASIVGPDGSVSGSGIWSVGYDISAAPDYTQAPWTDIDFPSFVLPTIFVPGESAPFVVGSAPGSAFTLEGSVQATSDGAGTQSVTSEIWEANFFLDTLMETRSFDVSTPTETFAGMLVPYSEPDWFLFKNGSGQIAGSEGSSGETTGDFYQFLTQPGASDPSSASVTVTVAP